MKKFLILPLICLAMSVQATTVLLWGWNNQWSSQPESVVQNQDGTGTRLVSDLDYDTEVNTIRVSEWSDGQFIRFLDIWFPAYTDEETGESFEASWEEGDIGIDAEPSDLFLTAFTQSALGENPDNTHVIKMEMLFIEWDDYGNPLSFSSFAEATATIGELNRYVYEQGDINPMYSIPWWPEVFYTDYPVPEPSITVLTILGACILLLKRKTYKMT